MDATRYTTRAECKAVIDATKGMKYGHTHFACGMLSKEYGEYYIVKALSQPLDGYRFEQNVRREDRVYTASGKKRTSTELCGRVFRKVGANKELFIAEAIKLGVKPLTARTMFHHHTKGYIAARLAAQKEAA